MKYHYLYLAARKIPLLIKRKIYILRPERTPRDERSATSREAESQTQCLLVPYEPCCQRIFSWPFSERVEDVASSRCWSESVIDSPSSCHIPLSPDRQILRALNKFRERNSIFLNAIASPVVKLLTPLKYFGDELCHCSTCLCGAAWEPGQTPIRGSVHFS